MSSAGFTLLEVLLSLVIFLLLAGGIFASVSVSMRVSTDLTLARLNSEREDALQRFLRHLFVNLSGTSQLELRVRTVGGGKSVEELLISAVPEFASFSPQSRSSGGLAIGAVPGDGGSPTLSLANFDDMAGSEERDHALRDATWIPLLPGINALRWRFAVDEDSGWQETWERAKGRPGLAELEVTMADGSRQLWTFLIPKVQPRLASQIQEDRR